MALWHFLGGALAVLSIAGCSDKNDPDALFSPEDPPTPNVLQGVYKIFADESGQTTELRLRFDGDTVAGALKCISKAKGAKTVVASGETDLSTNDIDSASGKITVGNLVLDKSDGDFFCQGGLRGGEYTFKVEDLRLTLTSKEIAIPIIYEKVGD